MFNSDTVHITGNIAFVVHFETSLTSKTLKWRHNFTIAPIAHGRHADSSNMIDKSEFCVRTPYDKAITFIWLTLQNRCVNLKIGQKMRGKLLSEYTYVGWLMFCLESSTPLPLPITSLMEGGTILTRLFTYHWLIMNTFLISVLYPLIWPSKHAI